ncbi:hypothetical protein [Chryseobacterium sp. JK1]|uniref:hypothetical protein n=1 Tax=Chryseobacterium sp. JK1 TaxID=874294 RepID=UPI003D68FE9B
MKFFLIVFLFLGTYAFCQSEAGNDIIIACIKEKVINEEKNGNEKKEFNVFLEQNGFLKINDTIINGKNIHFLSNDEIRKKSKKGFVVFNISPFIIYNNDIRIIIMKEFYKKKRISFLNKSIYVFNYDCKQEQFVLKDVNNQLW